MIPWLSEKYDIDIETISKPRAEFSISVYIKSGLPKAPAIIVGEDIVVEGSDITEDKLTAAICKHLNLETPKPKRGIIRRLLNR